jgi:hypothetical protein
LFAIADAGRNRKDKFFVISSYNDSISVVTTIVDCPQKRLPPPVTASFVCVSTVSSPPVVYLPILHGYLLSPNN